MNGFYKNENFKFFRYVFILCLQKQLQQTPPQERPLFTAQLGRHQGFEIYLFNLTKICCKKFPKKKEKFEKTIFFKSSKIFSSK